MLALVYIFAIDLIVDMAMKPKYMYTYIFIITSVYVNIEAD